MDDLEQRIRERAYEIWENEGCPAGRGDEHWRQACAEFQEAKAEADAQQPANLSGAGGAVSDTPSNAMEEGSSLSPDAAGRSGSAQGVAGG